MRKPLLAALAALGALLFGPADSFAQSRIYLRMLPEVALTSVEHTKEVTSSTGTSSSSSSTSRPEGGINFYLGYLAPVSENWLIGAEFRGTISLRGEIGGTTPSSGNGTHAVWPGPWDFANRVGLGGNILIARELPSINSRGYVFAGIARWNSDMRSAGADPASEEAVDDSRTTGRWPLNTGLGLTLPFARPLDVRLRYFRSATGWTASHNFNQQALEFDYQFVVSGLALSVGLGTR